MTLQIKADSWYRTRGGEIAYVAAIAPMSHITYPVYGWTRKETRSWTLDGNWVRGELSQPDLVEHLPDCDSFDCVPKPKIQLQAGKKYVLVDRSVVGPLRLLYASEPKWYDDKSNRVWNEAGEHQRKFARATENIVSEYVEPTPVYEPWDFESMPDFVRVKDKADGMRFTAWPLSENACQRGTYWMEYKELFDKYTQLDGTPCGRVKE